MIIKEELGFSNVVWAKFNPRIGHEHQSKRLAIDVKSNQQLKKSNLATIIPLS